MQTKQLYYSNTTNYEYLQNSISLFLKEVYDVMKECYGPYGSHVLIDNQVRPEATKDGKTILSRIQTNKSISKAVHGSIMSVANKQVEEVGDGSTTTILLLCKLYEKLIKIIDEKNVSPSILNRTMHSCVRELLEYLEMNAEKVVNEFGEIDFNTLYNAIYTSTDGDKELTECILEMFKELNTIDPLVLIELSPNEQHRYELVKGVESSGSIIRPEIFFNGLSRKEYNNPSIVVVNGRLDIKLEHYLNLAETCLRDDKDIIFLATGVSEDTLAGITSIAASNPAMFSRTPIFQIRNTSLNEEFRDLCASIGAKPIDSESFKRVTSPEAITNLIKTSSGGCDKALLTEFCARFNNPNTDKEAVDMILRDIEAKINDLKEDPTSHNARMKDLEDRKAFLSKHYAKFYVGGYSPQRKAINYELANDGIPQAISCLKHGIVDGCNTIIPKFIDTILNSEDYNEYSDLEKDIFKAIRDSYKELTIQLFENKYANYEMAERHINDNTFIDNMNMREGDNTPVINSADTDRAILQNSTDMAALLATSRGFISTTTEFDVVAKGYEE